MRDSYFTLEDNVLASVSMMPNVRDGSWIITGVEVSRYGRGQGRAREVLDQCLADADAEGVILWLSVDPQEFNIDFSRLASFYWSRGFRFVGGDGVTMRRDPEPRSMET